MMRSGPYIKAQTPDGSDGDPGGSTDEPWFVPPPPDDAVWDMPGPRADRPTPPDAAAWARAEAGQGRALADAAAALARLDERIAGGAGVARLALTEAAEIAWSGGAWIGVDRLALYDLLHVGSVDDDDRGLPGAHWALRRLRGGPGPLDGGADGLADFVDRRVGAETDMDGFRRQAQGWLGTVGAADLHPVSRAAFAFDAWRRLGLGASDAATEAAVIAARIGATGLTTLPFMPLAGGQMAPWQMRGDIAQRLANWLAAATAGASVALMQLDRQRAWAASAARAVRPLSGRTAPRLIDALQRLPAVSVAAAAEITGSSRASAQRNLTWFENHGLAREITGQSRFRLWAADLSAATRAPIVASE